MTWDIEAHQGANQAHVRKFVESPIERNIAHELLDAYMFRLAPDGLPDDLRLSWAYLIPQHKVGAYRLDFAIFFIVDDKLVKIDLECDGKDYHSTPDQVDRDSARNKALVSDGWIVLRYAGGPLHHRAGACADEIQFLIEQLMHSCIPYPLEIGTCFGIDKWQEGKPEW
jgi:very-short-patch-repair endonuclease